MEVVSAEVNSHLPEEIMDTGLPLVDDDDDSIEAVTITSDHEDGIPMETELDEIVNINSAEETQVESTTAESATLSRVSSSSCSSAGQLILTTVGPKQDPSAAEKSTLPSNLQKLGVSTPVTITANQIILNKALQASDLKPAGQVIKQEGQKLFVTTLAKSGQPIVLALPQSQLSQTQKATSQAQSIESKIQTQQIKLVTLGGRPEIKPVISVPSLGPGSHLISASGQSSGIQTSQLKTVQIAKKTTSSPGQMITKLFITKPLNSKAIVQSQSSSVSPVITGRILSQNVPGTPQKTITISESSIVGSTLNTQSQQTTSKIAISPLKSPNKLTVVSVASQLPNSPQKAVSVPLNMALGQQILTVQQSTPSSPAKAITNHTTTQAVKSAVQTVAVGGVGTHQFKTIIPLATTPNVQQIQTAGSKFHYVRLVSSTTVGGSHHTGSSCSSTQPLHQAKPVVVNATPVRMSVPIIPAQNVKQVVPKPLNATSQMVTTSQPQQRLIMPATPLPHIQPNLTNLPPGTVLAPAPGTGNLGYAVVPAQYVTQLQQSSYVAITSNSSLSGTTDIQTQARLPLNGVSASDSAPRPRKPCNCTKSLCLKLYCDCFANGEFCNNCNCTNCFNNLEHETERLKAIKACLDRNPEAFKPKIGKGKEGESDRRHSKGCNCKRSGCLKNYCECYEAKIMCSSICKCVGCKNFEESPERKTLMHLADAAEVRVQQQTAAKTKLSSQISDLLTRPTPTLTSEGGKLPFTFVTKEVAEATCECLLAQAEQAEKMNKPKAAAERMILEEFGRCLMRIINSAGKAKSESCSMNC
ncbi:protein lin-54 homolog [Latimeria chalumnae]|nr:PREDICTED: protein lin-54 homolog isoform X2 [Latimeria chalumnae]|eukprot:XP_014350433.1 PREDICTED: protein lin-54 homolog isoform X2 [Latimeria chalumnae]